MRQAKWMSLTAGLIVVAAMCLGGCGKSADGTDPADQRAYDDMATLKTVKEFEKKVEGADRPVLVDFYANWCGPCKQLAPVIGSLAREFEGRVDFFRVDVDQAGALAQEMGIKVIPTVFLYVNGEPAHTFNYAARETYAKALEAALAETTATSHKPPATR